MSVGLVLAIMVFYATMARAQNIADYSVLPEVIYEPIEVAPRILFILDNSGSMHFNIDGDRIGGHDPVSRSFAARAALREVFQLGQEEGLFSAGLMTFSLDFPDDRYTDNRHLGTLVSNIEPLNQAKVDELNVLLATEPEVVDGRYGTLIGDLFRTNGAIASWGGTPLRGSIQSAERYLVTGDLADIEISLPSGQAVLYPATESSASEECQGNLYVFFITDGVPSIAPDGSLVRGETSEGESRVALEVEKVAEAAATLREDGGVDTYVFSFQVGDDEVPFLNEIARGGSGRDAFLSNTGDQLVRQITDLILSIGPDRSSGTAASVGTSNIGGDGMLVSASYSPEMVTGDGSVSWAGFLRGYFIDRFGFLREDSLQDGELDDYSSDRAFTIEFDEDTGQVNGQRLTVNNVGEENFSVTPLGGEVPIDDIVPIWDAGTILSSYPPSTYTRHRFYRRVGGSGSSSGYRHIFTWIADDPNDLTASGEGKMVNFVPAVNGALVRDHFNLFDSGGNTIEERRENARDIIRYIRGVEGISGFRSRTLGSERYLLGDILHSSAQQVGAPNSGFDVRYNDASYRDFRETYSNRRRMVYVGANDGLLHAFNGGFYSESPQTFSINPGSEAVSPTTSNGSIPRHPLGSEIWAYAPMNLLPHLKFLTRGDYNSGVHVAFVDGSVQAFDVRAWDDNDNTHINGWGTIIVVGLRLGGGTYPPLDHDNDADTDDITTRSAYLVLDVTDPEVRPQVIAEITHPDLGFTTSLPTVTRTNCGRDSTDDDDITCDWHLAIGSGPTELKNNQGEETVVSRQTARLFRYRLEEDNWGFEDEGGGNRSLSFGESSASDSFVGDIAVVDWNNDYEHDSLYMGTIQGADINQQSGGLYRYVLDSNGDVDRLYDARRPIQGRPLPRRRYGREFVAFGSGRVFVSNDLSADTRRNYLHAITEELGANGKPNSDDDLDSNDLVDVTGVLVNADTGNLRKGRGRTDTTLRLPLPSSGTAVIATALELSDYVVNPDNPRRGWRRGMQRQVRGGGAPAIAGRSTTTPILLSSVLFFNEYRPFLNRNSVVETECGTLSPIGASFLIALDISTGTSPVDRNSADDVDGVFGSNQSTGNLIVQEFIGAGRAAESFVFIGENRRQSGSPETRIYNPKSTGEIVETPIDLRNVQVNPGRVSWREL